MLWSDRMRDQELAYSKRQLGLFKWMDVGCLLMRE